MWGLVIVCGIILDRFYGTINAMIDSYGIAWTQWVWEFVSSPPLGPFGNVAATTFFLVFGRAAYIDFMAYRTGNYVVYDHPTLGSDVAITNHVNWYQRLLLILGEWKEFIANKTEFFDRSVPNINRVGRYIRYGLGYMVVVLIVAAGPWLIIAFSNDMLMRVLYLGYNILGAFLVAVSLMGVLSPSSRNRSNSAQLGFIFALGCVMMAMTKEFEILMR